MPEIGDEVAVARALRHLADQLLDTAAQDLEAVTGEPAHIRPAKKGDSTSDYAHTLGA